jgi:hypothetical protein
MNKKLRLFKCQSFLLFIVLGLFSLFLLPTSVFATTILIDPGHGGCKSSCVHTEHGIQDEDSNNGAENQEVIDVATELETKLKAAGYNVIMTKRTAGEDISLWDRADKANKSKADLAISIHNDHGQPWSWAEIYAQRLDGYREKLDKTKWYFKDRAGANATTIAGKSQKCADIFKTERTAAEGHAVNLTVNHSFMTRPLAKGDIPWVQLLSDVPWVYNEVGASSGYSKDKYVTGLFNSIQKAVADKDCVDGSSSGSGTSSGSNVSCVITKVGNPKTPPPPLPPECTTSGSGGSGAGGPIIEWAQKIADKLEKGNNGNMSKLQKDVCNGKNVCAHKKPGPSTGSCYSDPNGVSNCYWCTWLVIDSYTLAGINIPQNLLAVGLYADMKKLNGFVGYDYKGGTADIANLQKVKPGYAIVFDGHIGLVKSIDVDARGNGTITTLESNSGSISHTWPIATGVIKNGGGHAIIGFAGQK